MFTAPEPASTLLPLLSLKLVASMIDATVAPLGMDALPLMRIPGVRIEVFPESSDTTSLPADVTTFNDPKSALTEAAVAVAGAEMLKWVPSRIFVTTGFEDTATPLAVAVAGSDN